jgi:hypothetical protein
MSTAELGTNTLSGSLLLVPDPGPAGGHAAVHVATFTEPSSTWFLRSVKDAVGGNPLGPLLTLGAPTPCLTNGDCEVGVCNETKGHCAPEGFLATAGWVTPGSSLVLQGLLSDTVVSVPPGFAEALFILSPADETVQMAAPHLTGWPTPPDCTQGVGVVNDLYIWGHAPARYVASCNLNSGSSFPYAASLWIGSNASPSIPVKVATGGTTDLLMNPSGYAFVNEQHFVAFGGKPATASAVGMGAFAYGPDAGMLQSTTPFTIVPNVGTMPMGLSPLATNDGFVLFIAAVDMALGNGSLWAGPVRTADFPGLAQTPPPTLKKVLSSPMANVNNPAVSPQGIVSAGATLDGATVELSWFDANGAPLVPEMEVYTAAIGTSVKAAAAAPLGSATLVVWSETSGSAFAVNAKKYLCSR